MNKIILTKKTSTILLAIVLVGGMIVISSPFSAYAQQQYQQDYESAYYPSDPEMAEDNQPVKIQKANCDNENVNINGVVQAQTQEQTLGSGGFNPGAGDAALTGQDLTPEEAFAAINGNGDPLITAERNIVNICINSNDNTLTGTFTSTQTQTPLPPCAEDVEACFAENLSDSVEFATLTAALENGLDVVIEGEPLTLNSFEDICSALEGLTFEQLRQAIIEIIVKAGIDILHFNLLTCIAEALDIPRTPP